MKYLKLFEAFGIDSNIEDQVDEYFSEIKSNPNKNEFNFLFQNDIENTFFKLKIDKNFETSGKFSLVFNSRYKEYNITIKDRNDDSVLLHEVKHLDYAIKNKNYFNKMENKAREVIKGFKDTPECLNNLFYLYDENEFESQYHGYYKEFKNFCKGKLNSQSKLTDVRNLWYKYLTSCEDRSWTYYLIDIDFKFDYYISNRKLNKCLYSMIESGITNSPDKYKWGKNWIINNIKLSWHQIKKELGIYSEEEKLQINKIRKYFETIFQQRHSKFRKKFTRMILLVADQYGIKY